MMIGKEGVTGCVGTPRWLRSFPLEGWQGVSEELVRHLQV